MIIPTYKKYITRTSDYYADQYAITTAKISDCWNYCDFSKTTEIVVAVLDTGVDNNHLI